MDEHPNVARVREALDAYNRGDYDAYAEHFADDILWHVGGDHEHSGDYRGKAAVVDYFRRVQDRTAGSLKLEPIEVLASDRHGGIFLRVTGERGGRQLETVLAEAIEFDDQGRWVEFWALAEDQDAVDEFWKGQ